MLQVEMKEVVSAVDEQRKELSLLGNLIKIVELSKDAGLSDTFLKYAKPNIDFAAKVLDLSDIQTVLFAHFLDFNCDDRANLARIGRSLKCEGIKFIDYMDDIDTLLEKRLICSSKPEFHSHNRGYLEYRVPLEVVNSIRKGETFKPASKVNLSLSKFFDCVDDIFTKKRSYEISRNDMKSDLKMLLENNRHLQIAQFILGYGLSDEDMILLLCFCYLFVDEADDFVAFHDIEFLFDRTEFRAIRQGLRNNEHSLISLGLIENCNDGGMADPDHFKLADKVKNEFAVELSINAKKRGKDFLLAQNLSAKNLFYDEKDARQIKELTSLLQEENFATIQKRLAESGMRKGFACLFYGEPGTGKTETVYQIAKQTGRDIMMIDISQLRTCWHGESEKLVKQSFDRYRAAAKSGGLIPILFFNEADGIFSKRTEVRGANAVIAKSENTIQNIILQEVENLDGILIATTNLTQNLDKAFERRFIYKIEFHKPSLDARKHIWQSIIPALSDTDAQRLSNSYDFSGGQIENIARKRAVDNIISGQEPNLDKLISFCNEEMLDKSVKRIGFI